MVIFDVARVLLAKGADVNSKNKGGWTPLISAAYDGRADVVKILIDKGADINASCKAFHGTGPFMTTLGWAQLKRHPDVVNILGNAGAKE